MSVLDRFIVVSNICYGINRKRTDIVMKKLTTKILALILCSATVLGLTACTNVDTSMLSALRPAETSENTSHPREISEPLPKPETAKSEIVMETADTEETDVSEMVVLSTTMTEYSTLPTEETEEEAEPNTYIQGGYSLVDAVEIPLDTKLYGTLNKGKEAQWFSFTTTSKVNASYAFTLINKSYETKPVTIFIHNQNGNILSRTSYESSHQATAYGRAHTETYELDPETTYYLKLYAENVTDFMLFVTDPYEEGCIRLLGTADATSDVNAIHGGRNQDDATFLPLQTKLYGTTEKGNVPQWYSFTTTDKVNATYALSLIQKTPGAKPVTMWIYNQYGVVLARSSYESDHQATNYGRAHTETYSLDPDTNFYLAIYSEDVVDYMLFLSDPDEMTEVNFLGNNEEAKDASHIAGGTDQDEATLLPLDTKLYGTSRKNVNAWYAFTTTDKENASYAITLIHKTVGAEDVTMWVYNKYGYVLSVSNYASDHSARWGGRAHTEVFNLAPNTTYYIAITSKNTVDYMIRVKDPSEKTIAINTATNITESRGTSGVLEGTVLPGTNQDDSAMIPLGVSVNGTVRDQLNSWLCFTTTDKENATYTITLGHKTPDAKPITIYVYNEYGTFLGRSNYASDHSAYSNGAVHSENFKLDPDTIYYIKLYSDDVVDYTLYVQQDGLPEVNTEAHLEEEEPALVFEVPFELTETQVHFIGDAAIFVDRNAAIAALTPVAEIILAHPEHPILLAGTTATLGAQESCVNLSNHRAAAVKELLVSEFGVPAEQLLTIGLGYEADPFVRGRDRDANGYFVETEAAKNRRVVVLDAADPIAKQLLTAE